MLQQKGFGGQLGFFVYVSTDSKDRLGFLLMENWFLAWCMHECSTQS
jgi:hypothetical protein